MKWSSMSGGVSTEVKPIQYFAYGPWEFNIRKAQILAADCRKYKPTMCQPSPAWVGPGIQVDHDHVGRTDPSRPLIFATIVKDGQAGPLLIDGHHRVLNALNRQRTVRAITLSLADTLKVLKAPDHFIQGMVRDGRLLGLLPTDELH